MRYLILFEEDLHFLIINSKKVSKGENLRVSCHKIAISGVNAFFEQTRDQAENLSAKSLIFRVRLTRARFLKVEILRIPN